MAKHSVLPRVEQPGCGCGDTWYTSSCRCGESFGPYPTDREARVAFGEHLRDVKQAAEPKHAKKKGRTRAMA